MTATNQHIRNLGRGKTHQTSPSIPHNQSGGESGRCNHRLSCGSGDVGGSPTDTPRCGVANLHTDSNSDNLLGINFLKTYDYEII